MYQRVADPRPRLVEEIAQPLPNAWAKAEALRLDYGRMGPFGIAP